MSYVQRHNTLLNEASLAYIYWQQRIKKKNLQVGNLPSKMLFGRLRQKQQHNHLHILRNNDGDWIQEPAEIEHLIHQHFRTLLTSSEFEADLPTDSTDLLTRELHLPNLTEDDCNELRCPISREEIKDTFLSLANDKSPRLDDYNAEFTLTEVIQRLFSTSFLLKEWNMTLLVLIPKVVPPFEVSHLRPISLCNVIYICIAKMHGE